MKKQVKLFMALISVVFATVLCMKASQISRGSLLWLFYSRTTAFLEEDTMRMNIPMGNSRVWINALKDDQNIFFLPAGSYVEKIYSFHNGRYLEIDDFEDMENIAIYRDQQLPSVFVSSDLSRSELLKDKEIVSAAQVQVYDFDGTKLQDRRIKFKGHGNGSWQNNEKKSWLLKFENDTSLLGMKAGIGYVAISNAQDGSHLRNYMTFEMARHMEMQDTPEGRFANLYLNGEYQGLYLLTTRIEASSERVRSVQETDKNPEMKAYKRRDLLYEENEDGKGYIYPEHIIEDPADTGYLLSQVSKDCEDRYKGVNVGFRIGDESRMGIFYPRRASIDQTMEVREYMESFLSAVQRAVDTDEMESPDNSYLDYIDIDSFARQHLLEQFIKNHDAHSSNYFTIQNLKNDPKLYEGPVWDYDLAYGNYEFGADWNTAEGFVSSTSKMNKISSFVAMQQEYYVADLKPYLETGWKMELQKMEQRIAMSAEMDRIRWPQNPYIQGTFEEEVDQLDRFVSERKAFFDDSILNGTEYERCNFVQGTKVIGCIYVPSGERLMDTSPFLQEGYPEGFMEPENVEGLDFVGWFEENLETPIDFSKPVTESVACYGKWE